MLSALLKHIGLVEMKSAENINRNSNGDALTFSKRRSKFEAHEIVHQIIRFTFRKSLGFLTSKFFILSESSSSKIHSKGH